MGAYTVTLARRIIVCLDVDGGRVVKGTQFTALRDVGEPSEMAERYEAEGADEIVFLDISASAERRGLSLESVRRTAERVFTPLTVGGGIRSVEEAERALRAGADKVAINTAALEQPRLVSAMAKRFGRQCVVVSIDAKRVGESWIAHSHGGRRSTDRDAIAWASECTSLGAGEILVTSIDRDGTREGYDVALTAAVASRVDVPVIASGGAGNVAHVIEGLERGAADAALVAGILHDREIAIADIKRGVAAAGLPIRQIT